MSRVLVTGASGFLGRHLVEALVKRGLEVFAVSRTGVPAVCADAATWLSADLLQVESIGSLMTRVRPSSLVHLAWYAEPGLFWGSAENYRWTEATLALYRAFADQGGARVVGAGTCAEYDWRFGFCSEGLTPLSPGTPYGVCKNAVREITEALCRSAGISGAWARLFFLYGPHEHGARLVPTVIRHLLRGQTAELTSGGQVRDFLHVADAADAIAALLSSGVEGPVNIGSGVGTAVGALALAIGERMGRPDALAFGALPSDPDEPPFLVADVRRLRGEVGWSQSMDLDAGLEDTISWWRMREAR
jgi:nucleoside-diphosphate-sugar epimerase